MSRASLFAPAAKMTSRNRDFLGSGKWIKSLHRNLLLAVLDRVVLQLPQSDLHFGTFRFAPLCRGLCWAGNQVLSKEHSLPQF